MGTGRNLLWIDNYYPDDVDMMDALIVSVNMVLVCFFLHTVDGINVAMHYAQTLLKLEDSASNMATRSQLAAWIDAVIRALRADFAKDMEPTIVVMCVCVSGLRFRGGVL